MNYKIALLGLIILASGCTGLQGGFGEEKKADLIVKVSDNQVTNSSPAEITLNARNLQENETFLYATVRPVGDYQNVVRVTDRQGNIKSGFGLGDAPMDATTGETFALVEKRMNISSTVRLDVELLTGKGEEVLDSKTVRVKVKEEQFED